MPVFDANLINFPRTRLNHPPPPLPPNDGFDKIEESLRVNWARREAIWNILQESVTNRALEEVISLSMELHALHIIHDELREIVLYSSGAKPDGA